MTPVVEAKCQLTGSIVILAPFALPRGSSSPWDRPLDRDRAFRTDRQGRDPAT
jgi:hypothetical protein